MTQIESRQGGDFHSPGASISQIHTVRVVAMLGVFLHHLWNTVILTPTGPFQWGLDVLFDTASDGVILFNMLSGFLLALPYLGPERRPFVGYRIFLHRRFLRIVPPYFLALVLFSLANVLVFGISSRFGPAQPAMAPELFEFPRLFHDVHELFPFLVPGHAGAVLSALSPRTLIDISYQLIIRQTGHRPRRRAFWVGICSAPRPNCSAGSACGCRFLSTTSPSSSCIR